VGKFLAGCFNAETATSDNDATIFQLLPLASLGGGSTPRRSPQNPELHFGLAKQTSSQIDAVGCACSLEHNCRYSELLNIE